MSIWTDRHPHSSPAHRTDRRELKARTRASSRRTKERAVSFARRNVIIVVAAWLFLVPITMIGSAIA